MARVDRIRHPWLSQPYDDRPQASLAWRAKGLVALFDCRLGVEIISGARASVDGVPRAPSTSGTGADFSTQAMRFAHRAAYGVTGPLTIVVLCDVDALTNYSALVAKQGATNNHTPYELRLGSSPTNAAIIFGRAGVTAGDYVQQTVGANLVTAGARAVLLAFTDNSSTIDGTRVTWVNGVASTMAYFSGNPGAIAVADDATADVWIGQRFDSATQLDGRIFYVALFAGVLPDADLAAINANRYTLYEDQIVAVPRGIVAAGAPAAAARYYYGMMGQKHV